MDEVGASYAEAIKTGHLVRVLGDVSAPPFADNTFDTVICQNVVECVIDRAALVAQARRILRP